MHYIFGIVFRDGDAEVIEDNTPGKGSLTVLPAVIRKGHKMMDENPSIRRINIYHVIQGQNVLSHVLGAERNSRLG